MPDSTTKGVVMARMPAQRFEDLIVWQKAHNWVLAVYRYSASFPRPEVYGLPSQIRQAAVSVPANIAEGFKKRGVRDKARFLNIAQGSLEECRYYLILCRDLGYGARPELTSQLIEVSKLLQSYVNPVCASDNA